MPQALDAPVLIATRLLDDPQLVKWAPVPWGDVLFVAEEQPYPRLWLEEEDSTQGPLQWAWIVGASIKQYKKLIEGQAAPGPRQRQYEKLIQGQAAPGPGQRQSAIAALGPFLSELELALERIEGGAQLCEGFAEVLTTWTAGRLAPQPTHSRVPVLASHDSRATKEHTHSEAVSVLWPMWKAPRFRREKKEKPDDVPVTPRLLTLLGLGIHGSADWRRRTREEYQHELRGLLKGGHASESGADPAPAAFDFARGVSALGAALSRAPGINAGMEVDDLVVQLVDRLWDIYAAQIAPLDRSVAGTEPRAGRGQWLQVLYPVLDVLLSGTPHLPGLPRSNRCYLAGRIMECLELWEPKGAGELPNSDDPEEVLKYEYRCVTENKRLYQKVEKIQDRRTPAPEPEPRTPTPDQEARWGADQRWRLFEEELLASTAGEWKVFVKENQQPRGSSGAVGSVVYKLYMTRRRSSDRGWVFKHQLLGTSKRPRGMRPVAFDELLCLEHDKTCIALEQGMKLLRSFVKSPGKHDKTCIALKQALKRLQSFVGWPGKQDTQP